MFLLLFSAAFFFSFAGCQSVPLTTIPSEVPTTTLPNISKNLTDEIPINIKPVVGPVDKVTVDQTTPPIMMSGREDDIISEPIAVSSTTGSSTTSTTTVSTTLKTVPPVTKAEPSVTQPPAPIATDFNGTGLQSSLESSRRNQKELLLSKVSPMTENITTEITPMGSLSSGTPFQPITFLSVSTTTTTSSKSEATTSPSNETTPTFRSSEHVLNETTTKNDGVTAGSDHRMIATGSPLSPFPPTPIVVTGSPEGIRESNVTNSLDNNPSHTDVNSTMMESTNGSSALQSKNESASVGSRVTSVVTVSSSSIVPSSTEAAVPVISNSTKATEVKVEEGENSSMKSGWDHAEARDEKEMSGESNRSRGEEDFRESGKKEQGRSTSSSPKNINFFKPEVNVSDIRVTNYAAAPAPVSESPLDPHLLLEPASGRQDVGPASSPPAGNNLSPSDNVAPEVASSSPSFPPSSSPHTTSQPMNTGVKEGVDANFNHHSDHHTGEGEQQENAGGEHAVSREPTDEPSSSPESALLPSSTPTTGWQDDLNSHPDHHPHDTELNSMPKTTPSPVPPFLDPVATNHTTGNGTDSSFPGVLPSGNMTNDDDAAGKCNPDAAAAASGRHNLSSMRFNTFEAIILMFILVFVICAVFVLIFVFTIFRRKGNLSLESQVRASPRIHCVFFIT